MTKDWALQRVCTCVHQCCCAPEWSVLVQTTCTQGRVPLLNGPTASGHDAAVQRFAHSWRRQNVELSFSPRDPEQRPDPKATDKYGLLWRTNTSVSARTARRPSLWHHQPGLRGQWRPSTAARGAVWPPPSCSCWHRGSVQLCTLLVVAGRSADDTDSPQHTPLPHTPVGCCVQSSICAFTSTVSTCTLLGVQMLTC